MFPAPKSEPTAMDIELRFSDDDDEGSVCDMEFEDSQSQPTSSLDSAILEEYLEFDEDEDFGCLDDAHEETVVEGENEEEESDVDMTEDAEAEGSDTE